MMWWFESWIQQICNSSHGGNRRLMSWLSQLMGQISPLLHTQGISNYKTSQWACKRKKTWGWDGRGGICCEFQRNYNEGGRGEDGNEDGKRKVRGERGGEVHNQSWFLSIPPYRKPYKLPPLSPSSHPPPPHIAFSWTSGLHISRHSSHLLRSGISWYLGCFYWHRIQLHSSRLPLFLSLDEGLQYFWDPVSPTKAAGSWTISTWCGHVLSGVAPHLEENEMIFMVLDTPFFTPYWILGQTQ